MNELDRLTEEQHNLCYELQFALMQAIADLDHEKLWELIQKAIEEKEPKGGRPTQAELEDIFREENE